MRLFVIIYARNYFILVKQYQLYLINFFKLAGMNIEITKDVILLVTVEDAWYYKIVPYFSNSNSLKLYMDESINLTAELKNELEVVFDKNIEIDFKNSDYIETLLNKYYRRNHFSKNEDQVFDLELSNQDHLEKIIKEAEMLGSSDIHIEIYELKARIRFRIDGHLIERVRINLLDYPSLINMIKIRSGMDISEKRLPQDGRIFYKNENSKFDIRVSSLPTLYGEKIVMRLLTNKIDNIDIYNIGLTEGELGLFLSGLRKPNGIILISGPTGSGKTTTLYATLKYLNNEVGNIMTIEDPIEYTLEGINQVQVKDNIGFTFAQALRTFLRQDPDVIMLGEIRDGETAQMAIRASLTGHLVLSTIHTNSALATISRLIDMGVPPYLIANTLNFSIAQRLVRKLCNSCKKEQNIEDEYLKNIIESELNKSRTFVSVGCNKCFHTGYQGRIAIYEIVEIDDYMINRIKNNDVNENEIIQQKKIHTLRKNALNLLKNGVTSIDEVYPLIHS